MADSGDRPKERPTTVVEKGGQEQGPIRGTQIISCYRGFHGKEEHDKCLVVGASHRKDIMEPGRPHAAETGLLSKLQSLCSCHNTQSECWPNTTTTTETSAQPGVHLDLITATLLGHNCENSSRQKKWDIEVCLHEQWRLKL